MRRQQEMETQLAKEELEERTNEVAALKARMAAWRAALKARVALLRGEDGT